MADDDDMDLDWVQGLDQMHALKQFQQRLMQEQGLQYQTLNKLSASSPSQQRGQQKLAQEQQQQQQRRVPRPTTYQQYVEKAAARTGLYGDDTDPGSDAESSASDYEPEEEELLEAEDDSDSDNEREEAQLRAVQEAVDAAEGGGEDLDAIDLRQAGEGADDKDRDSAEEPVDDEAGPDLFEFQELQPGEQLPQGSRLAKLYEALAANRALQQRMLALTEKVDQLNNTAYTLEQKTKPPPKEPRIYFDDNAGDLEPGLDMPQADVLDGLGEGAPGAQLVEQQQQQQQTPRLRRNHHLHATSHFWLVNGKSPELRPELRQACMLRRTVPLTYERIRWAAPHANALVRGVEAELRMRITERYLHQVQGRAMAAAGTAATATAAAPPSGLAGEGAGSGAGTAAATAAETGQADASGGGGAGSGAMPTQEEMLQEFERIKAISHTSPEGRAEVRRFDDNTWARIARSHVRRHGPGACRLYYHHAVLAPLTAGCGWSADERLRLGQLVDKYGKTQWARIAEELGTGRTPAQCLQQHLRAARPNTNFGSSGIWQEEDDTKLKELYATYGSDWKTISQHFGGRFDRDQVRDRWHGCHKAASGFRVMGRWSAQEDKQLLAAVARFQQLQDATTADANVPTNPAAATAQPAVLPNGNGSAAMAATAEPRISAGGAAQGVDALVLSNKGAAGGTAKGKGMGGGGGKSGSGLPWARIAEAVPGRTPRQCRERYENVLRPDLAKGAFSEEEEATLKRVCAQLQAAHGRIQWSLVASHLPGRTDDMCHRAWRSLQKGKGILVGLPRQPPNFKRATPTPQPDDNDDDSNNDDALAVLPPAPAAAAAGEVGPNAQLGLMGAQQGQRQQQQLGMQAAALPDLPAPPLMLQGVLPLGMDAEAAAAAAPAAAVQAAMAVGTAQQQPQGGALQVAAAGGGVVEPSGHVLSQVPPSGADGTGRARRGRRAAPSLPPLLPPQPAQAQALITAPVLPAPPARASSSRRRVATKREPLETAAAATGPAGPADTGPAGEPAGPQADPAEAPQALEVLEAAGAASRRPRARAPRPPKPPKVQPPPTCSPRASRKPTKPTRLPMTDEPAADSGAGIGGAEPLPGPSRALFADGLVGGGVVGEGHAGLAAQALRGLLSAIPAGEGVGVGLAVVGSASQQPLSLHAHNLAGQQQAEADGRQAPRAAPRGRAGAKRTAAAVEAAAPATKRRRQSPATAAAAAEQPLQQEPQFLGEAQRITLGGGAGVIEPQGLSGSNAAAAAAAAHAAQQAPLPGASALQPQVHTEAVGNTSQQAGTGIDAEHYHAVPGVPGALDTAGQARGPSRRVRVPKKYGDFVTGWGD